MKKPMLHTALRNLGLAIALGAATLFPLALASCVKPKEEKAQDMGHDMSKMPKGTDMPKGDDHKDHQH